MNTFFSEKRTGPELFLTCVSVCALVLISVSFLIRAGGSHADLYNFLLLRLIQPVTFFLLAYVVFTGKVFRNKAWLLLLLLALWYLFCCYADRWVFELKKSEQKVFLYFLISAAVTFPFAKVTKDVYDRKILDVFLGVMILACSVLWWTAYVGVYNHELYTVLGYNFGAEYTYTGRLILRIMSMHQYRSGFIASAFAFISFYLAVSHPKKPVIIAAVLMEITYIPSVIMSGGRTDIFGFAIGILYILVLLIRRKKLSKKVRIAAAAGAAAGITAAAFEGMNLVYRHVTHSIRDVWYGMTTLTSRTEIWGGLIASYKDNPKALWTGYPWYNAMDIANEYIPLEDEIPHMHSSFMQTLAVCGIPGLALMIAVILCVIINGLRIFKADEESGAGFKEKLLFTVPLCMILEGTMEIIIFADTSECIFANALFMLLSGYVVFTGEKLNEDDRIRN